MAWSRNAPVCSGVQTMTGPGTLPVRRQCCTRSSVHTSGLARSAGGISTHFAALNFSNSSRIAPFNAARRVQRGRRHAEELHSLMPPDVLLALVRRAHRRNLSSRRHISVNRNRFHTRLLEDPIAFVTSDEYTVIASDPETSGVETFEVAHC